MKTCKLCNRPIESWQSWQTDLDDYIHTACALGETPRSRPAVKLKTNEWVTFTPNEPRHRPHVDTDKDTS